MENIEEKKGQKHSIKTEDTSRRRPGWTVQSLSRVEFFAKKYFLPNRVELLPGPVGSQLSGGLVHLESHFWKAIWKYVSWAIKICHTFWTSNLPSGNLS